MPDSHSLLSVESLLWLGDDALILAQRLSEWCGHAPALEEDIALSNIALDLLGQARAFLTLAGQREEAGRDEDALAFFRNDRDFRNLLLVEQPNGDFGDTITRQFLFDQFAVLRYQALSQQVADLEVAAIAAKALKEVKYHAAHSSQWLIRLGDGTEESHQRMQQSVNKLWMYSGECFDALPESDAWYQASGMTRPDPLKTLWIENVTALMQRATLTIPSETWMQSGGRKGVHTENLSYLLAEMQVLPRTYPNAKW